MDGLLHTSNMVVSSFHHRGQGPDVLDAKVFKAVDIWHMGLWVPIDISYCWRREEPVVRIWQRKYGAEKGNREHSF